MDLGIVIWTIIGVMIIGVCYLLFMELRDLYNGYYNRKKNRERL